MEFHTLINQYIDMLGCSARELADASGLSNAVISRYRSGERKPAPDSEQLEKIADGISKLAAPKQLSDLTTEKLLDEFREILGKDAKSYADFANKFSMLIDTLKINMKDLSAATNYETSYLYRIRLGQRHPNDLNAFANSICHFVASHFDTPNNQAVLAKLIACSPEDLYDVSACTRLLKSWLTDIPTEAGDEMSSFLKKLDEFDLDEYIHAIHFDKMKVPSFPFYKVSDKHYYGIEEMRKGELDFFKATVLSRSKEPIFMCSDMPMADMAEDMDFNKKWMFGIAMSLKKGLHLNIIHNIDRPFEEMMLGLEAWIPIYMTGQISPYHLPDLTTNIYHHFNYVSGAVALTGECIDGYHGNGKYYLTGNREEVAYYRQKAKALLSKAKPLMEIYRSPAKQQFCEFEKHISTEAGTRYCMLSVPPIYSISDDLLTRILQRSNASTETCEEVRAYVKLQRTLTSHTLQTNHMSIVMSNITEQEFDKHPVALSLSGLFREAEICYTYEEYAEHVRLTEQYANENTSYTLKCSDDLTFRNIQVQLLENKCIVISKEKTPSIHFVIRHPKMLDAMYHFYLSE
ncbi:MAG: helix-turn-helix transcriptional regulator [Lachnospiraceae bacterium]|nr:helix-turn-helix transcriptional regulator [Lachnospiraceae bacterium]